VLQERVPVDWKIVDELEALEQREPATSPLVKEPIEMWRLRTPGPCSAAAWRISSNPLSAADRKRSMSVLPSRTADIGQTIAFGPACKYSKHASMAGSSLLLVVSRDMVLPAQLCPTLGPFSSEANDEDARANGEAT
jgi:hypothetical protein